jgi:hypothetical protein
MEMSGQLHAPAALSPKERALDINWVPKMGWPQSRSVRDSKEENPRPYQKLNPGRPTLRLVTILTELSRHLYLALWYCYVLRFSFLVANYLLYNFPFV